MTQTSIKTPITELLNVTTPVVSAAMAGASSGTLAAKVTLAGGFGFTAAGYDDINAFKADLELARSTFHESSRETPQGQDIGATADTTILPIGVGFLGWILDESSDSSEKIKVALEARVTAVWFSFGTDLEKWITFVRKYDSERTVPHKTLVFVLVNSLEEALKATEQWKVDVLIVQSNEAGGHGHSRAPPLLSLLPEVLSAIPNGPPILAAGGISTGSQLAAALTLGAAGAVVGTRFLLTPESKFSGKQKELLLAAKSSDTVRTVAFDVARGTTGWPAGIDGRGLRSATVDNYDQGLSSDEVKTRFVEAKKRGDPAGYVTWSGSSIGLINEIKSADEIVRELHADAVRHLQRAYSLVIPKA